MVLAGGTRLGTLVVERRLESRHGELYLGRQPALERQVVVRVLARNARDVGRVERFRREARFGARIRHDNVVAVLDAFEDDGAEALVLEHVEGRDLERALAGRGTPPPGVAVAIALGAARGLEAIHAAGVVHGGLRPRKVLVSTAGDVVLTGLAEAREAGEERPRVTPPATPFSAPELDSETGNALDARADVFSLCALACAVASGSPRRGRRSRLHVPARLRRAIDRGLALDPADRPALGEVIRALERADPAPAAEVAAWLRLAEVRPRESGVEVASTRRLPLAWGIGIAAALAVAAGATSALLRGPQPWEPTPPVSAAPARVSVHAVPWAEVRVDDGEPFFTPRAEPLALAPGEHEIVFRHPTYGEARRTVHVAAGETKRVRHVYLPGRAE